MSSDDYSRLSHQLYTLTAVLQSYKWLTDSYMLEFFTKELYALLPRCWRENNMSIEDFGHFLTIEEQLPIDIKVVLPLSLLSLRSILSKSSLFRKQDSICYSSPYFKEICNSILNEPAGTKCMHHPRLKNLFLKHVKPKKRAEITRMAAETAKLSSVTGAVTVVDIGSGLGHLIRTLAYGYGLCVIGVELQEALTSKAEILDKELELTASKHLPPDDMKTILRFRPKHLKRKIDVNTDKDVLSELISDSLGSERDFGIVGLHPCGNLASTLLNIFVTCNRAKFINIVGCCYHKITFSDTLSTINIGFPLSKHLSNHAGIISPESASLGCHAMETYSNRLKSGQYDNLKIHCYRASIERIITRRWPHHARAGLNNVKHYPQLSFPEYCEKALKKLGLKIPAEDFARADTIEDLSRWKEAAIYHSILLMFGPVIESVILWDRTLFLIENGMHCKLQAAFDPLVSPRNHILAAVKPS